MRRATSRIIVKNLPKHVTDKRLREHFAQKGDITDVKLMKTPCVPASVSWWDSHAHVSHRDGKSRRFAFVGYRTEKEAKQAVTYFNNTFIDTSKVSVELAKAVRRARADEPRHLTRRRADPR